MRLGPIIMSACRYRGYDVLKRFLDIALASLALLLTAPLWLVAAAIIVIASPGPVFFLQQRVGRDHRPFRLLKFRTMHVRRSGAVESDVTTGDDPRVFPGARWMRKSKLDELPQLLNVLSGSMSLVGPRPTVQSDYDRMNCEQQRRAEVLPGMTGLAQIRGGAGVPWPERLRWDLKYIRERSVSLDLSIMAETAWLLLQGRAPAEAVTHDEWGLEGAET
jgi:lipopolysaccharide/colanic/teichoic acid biosynthesis glycosyltransferase